MCCPKMRRGRLEERAITKQRPRSAGSSLLQPLCFGRRRIPCRPRLSLHAIPARAGRPAVPVVDLSASLPSRACLLPTYIAVSIATERRAQTGERCESSRFSIHGQGHAPGQRWAVVPTASAARGLVSSPCSPYHRPWISDNYYAAFPLVLGSNPSY